MFVGEAPGEPEDSAGSPFVGQAGKRLRTTLKSLGYDPKDVYLTNTVMCRPQDDRDPKKDEHGVCAERLREQIRILDPLLIVGLGRVAAQALLTTGQGITDLRGRMFRYKMQTGELHWTISTFLTYHPAFIDRNPAAQQLWEGDLQNALRYIGELKGALNCL